MERPTDPDLEEHLERRFEQIQRGVVEGIRREVEWLKRHGYPVWVWENGRVVDANEDRSGGRAD